MAQFEDLEKVLERIGLTENERKIYSTLLNAGPLSASEVGDITGIEKFNVYPTLKNLVRKKFLSEQPTHRASKYMAVPPEEIMTDLQKDLKDRYDKEHKEMQEISEIISKIPLRPPIEAMSPSDSVWLINSEARIKTYILQLLTKAKNSIIAFLPTIEDPIYTQTKEEILKVLQERTKNMTEKFSLILNWELKNGSEDTKIAAALSKSGADVYEWGEGELPFGAFLIDNSEGLIILQSTWDPLPKFGLALWIRHPAYVKPFEQFIKRINSFGAFKKWS